MSQQQFAPYEASKTLLCRHERIRDCSYAGMNGQIMNYSLDHPYHLKTLVDPNVLVFDNVDLYPQALCDKSVLTRGNNRTVTRVIEESCFGRQCFVSTPVKGGKAFEINTKPKDELPSPYVASDCSSQPI